IDTSDPSDSSATRENPQGPDASEQRRAFASPDGTRFSVPAGSLQTRPSQAATLSHAFPPPEVYPRRGSMTRRRGPRGRIGVYASPAPVESRSPSVLPTRPDIAFLDC